ncbi:MAG TPA: phenylalanine--tRNA ligase subunit beta, partial [Firmicutes bacterium]|nr:phenylalanine--tRNA ligase subunit beta [Bacillota bacterium]
MLVSLKEIRKYVDLNDISDQEIANRLTFAGIEVEEIKTLANATNLVIGKIIKCDPVEGSNHLHTCKVDIKSEILDIVCGAPNARVGLNVIVAKVGAKLPKGEIKKGSLLGHESNGMLCALNELGVEEKYLKKEQIEGIEELPDDAPIGSTDVLNYLGLDDTILDLKLLANRSDCNGLFNVAREIAALFKRKLNLPHYEDNANYIDEDFKVSSETSLCDSFLVRIFKDIEIKDSPKWLKEVLRSEGIRSINNIVDIGNYVMLLTGQPVHMYDLDKLLAHNLIVKDNLNDEVVALDDNSYSIENGDLVVT